MRYGALLTLQALTLCTTLLACPAAGWLAARGICLMPRSPHAAGPIGTSMAVPQPSDRHHVRREPHTLPQNSLPWL